MIDGFIGIFFMCFQAMKNAQSRIKTALCVLRATVIEPVFSLKKYGPEVNGVKTADISLPNFYDAREGLKHYRD